MNDACLILVYREQCNHEFPFSAGERKTCQLRAFAKEGAKEYKLLASEAILSDGDFVMLWLFRLVKGDDRRKDWRRRYKGKLSITKGKMGGDKGWGSRYKNELGEWRTMLGKVVIR